MTRRTLDLRKFAAVEPGVLYPVAAVAELFGKTEDAVRSWWRKGGLPWVTDPTDPRRRLISGEAVLAALGGLAPAAPGGPTETERQRAERARRDREECRRLAREKARGAKR